MKLKLSEVETKLNYLNDTLIKEEERVFNSVKKIKDFADQLLERGEICDYYFDLEVQGFKSPEDEDSFFKSKTNMLLAQINQYKNYTLEDYTESLFLPFKDLKWNQPHCITFHDLCCHTDLQIEEILKISEIWLEVNVTYQFITRH